MATALVLLVVGAVLAFAVDATVAGLDIDALGIILMIAGAAGLWFSLLRGDGFGGMTRTRTVVQRTDAPVVRRRVGSVVVRERPSEVVERETVTRSI